MKVLVTGGGGFLGRKIAARLARDGTLGGAKVTGLTLFDMAAPPPPMLKAVTCASASSV